MNGDSFDIEIERVQPSQLLIDIERVRSMLEWFNPDSPTYNPIPVVPATAFDGIDDGRFVATDGHTRLFMATLVGASTVHVVIDDDWPTLSQATYRACVRWCLDADVTTPADLIGRVVSRDRFLSEWVERCEAYQSD